MPTRCSFWNFEILGDDFETAPKQLVAIVVREFFREFLHGGIVNRGRVKADAFEVGSAHARNGEIFILWHSGDW